MSSYKGLILGAVSLLIGLSVYGFYRAGVPQLIADDVERGGKSGSSYGVSALEVFSGVYECIKVSGCENTTRLMLQQDTTLDITAVIDGQEVSLGQGTWGIGSNGALILLLQNSGTSTGRSIIAKKISTIKISGFSNKKNLFPGMENPTFTRIRNDDAPTGSN